MHVINAFLRSKCSMERRKNRNNSDTSISNVTKVTVQEI